MVLTVHTQFNLFFNFLWIPSLCVHCPILFLIGNCNQIFKSIEDFQIINKHTTTNPDALPQYVKVSLVFIKEIYVFGIDQIDRFI